LDQSANESENEHWTPPVLKTVSTEAVGIEKVVKAIGMLAAFLRKHNQWHIRDAARLQEELNELLMAAFAAEWRKKVEQSRIETVLGEMLERKLSPQSAAFKLLSV
jgi:LAO/AO transport system kinase